MNSSNSPGYRLLRPAAGTPVTCCTLEVNAVLALALVVGRSASMQAHLSVWRLALLLELRAVGIHRYAPVRHAILAHAPRPRVGHRHHVSFHIQTCGGIFRP